MVQNSRLIDADVAFRFFKDQKVKETGAYAMGLNQGLNIAKSAIHNPDAIPSVDAVEVVRCKKCVHGIPAEDDDIPNCYMCVEASEFDPESGLYAGFTSYHTGDFFCSYGERRNNG